MKTDWPKTRWTLQYHWKALLGAAAVVGAVWAAVG